MRKAAASDFPPDFDWLDDKVEQRVRNDEGNRRFTTIEIRELAREWILGGGKIVCTPEKRVPYKDKRHFHYDVVVAVASPDDFPYGLYVEMQLSNPDEDEPAVGLLNAHPERGF